MMKLPPILIAAALAVAIPLTSADDKPPADAGVSVAEDDASFTLANNFVAAKVSKRSGDLVSLKYKGLEMLGSSRQPGGYWSHGASGPKTIASITIDPKANKGDRGEVSVKAISGGAA